MPHANFTKGTKVCSRAECKLAGQEQLITNFAKNRDTADGLQHACKECANLSKKAQKRGTPELRDKSNADRQIARMEKKENVAKGQLQVLAKAVQNKAKVTHIEELAGVLMETFGGVKGYATTLVNAIETAENPGHKIRGLLGAASIFGEASKLAAVNAADLDLISDEELDARIEEAYQRRMNAGAIDVEFKKEIVAEPDID